MESRKLGDLRSSMDYTPQCWNVTSCFSRKSRWRFPNAADRAILMAAAKVIRASKNMVWGTGKDDGAMDCFRQAVLDSEEEKKNDRTIQGEGRPAE